MYGIQLMDQNRCVVMTFSRSSPYCLPFRRTWVHPYFFCGVHIARSLVYCVGFCILLFVLLPIVLSVILRFTDYDYPFGIINLFLQWLEHERAKDWLNWKSCNDVYSISLNVFFIKDSTKVHMTWLIKIQLNMILYYLLIKYEIWYRTLLQTVCIII